MIEYFDFSKSYKTERIIDRSDFSFKDNEISFLMAPNGSGKTTLIRCLCGIEKYEGKILVNGKAVSEIGQNVFVVWDDTPFFDRLSGYNNLRIFSQSSNLNKTEIQSICNKYLPHDTLRRKVKTYSYGQKKKLALILVEILKPSILIMDEISNGLDHEMMKDLKNTLKEMSKHTTILLTGHQFEFYEGITDSLYIIKDKLVMDITSEFINSGDLNAVYERYF